MRKIFSLLVIFGIIFVFGCSKEEPITTISAGVITEIEAEEEIVEVVEEERENITTVRLCHDTDNGIVRWVEGSVFGFYSNATRFEFKDYCQNFNYLWEFYCEDENPMQRIFLCRNGCEDNHCL
jgi:hypothetical protein